MELQQEAMLLRSGPFEHIAEMKAEKKGSRRYKMGVQVLADSEKWDNSLRIGRDPP